MQGRKVYTEKLFTSFHLSDHVPEDNFYRRLKGVLDLSFLRKTTKQFYGSCGQQSIDPVVFFKLMLVGYLENLVSDRALMRHCKMRLDILYFLDYDIDEPLPWHSALSRTRGLIPENIFVHAFENVLGICVQAGLVGGHTQAIDSAPVKANASMESLEVRIPAHSLKVHVEKVQQTNEVHGGCNVPDPALIEAAKNTKESSDTEQVRPPLVKVDVTQEQKTRVEKNAGTRPNNKTHYSPIDPDARMSKKPGKATKLNYAAHLAVDTKAHVITHASAHHADKKDSQELIGIAQVLKTRLEKQGLSWQRVLADTGYSSGENYAQLKKQALDAYIPPHGKYKGGPDNFTYHKDGDFYVCPNGMSATFRSEREDKNVNDYRYKYYATEIDHCKGCPLMKSCIGKGKHKRFMVTAYREEYEEMICKTRTNTGRKMRSLRHSTVEPVLGSLTQYFGLRKVNTKGIKNANKCTIVSAMAYNLKKYVKHIKPQKRITQVAAKALDQVKAIVDRKLVHLQATIMRFSAFRGTAPQIST